MAVDLGYFESVDTLKSGKRMSEADLLMLHTELLASAWSVIQVWIGATTALVGAAYLCANRFSISLLIALLGLYTIFSASCIAQVGRHWSRILAIARDLLALQDEGLVLSHSSLVLIQNIDSRLVATILMPTAVVVFLASVLYTVYCYRTGKAHAHSSL